MFCTIYFAMLQGHLYQEPNYRRKKQSTAGRLLCIINISLAVIAYAFVYDIWGAEAITSA